ncbi:hypothetical protein HELRODRAFT_178444 [Helobdella robusta]|uniref:Uncharacterized protein n=1 Tax=Helobdella robusta TaxID=6412 RepID=T1FD64_HELRO|nr:hypothetical protein HELRODRAFT_178444 [Helobdella robusta]ESN97008.1 hypothetical protein HELRODRAFT_178444 [Helobdella robusta]
MVLERHACPVRPCMTKCNLNWKDADGCAVCTTCNCGRQNSSVNSASISWQQHCILSINSGGNIDTCNIIGNNYLNNYNISNYTDNHKDAIVNNSLSTDNGYSNDSNNNVNIKSDSNKNIRNHINNGTVNNSSRIISVINSSSSVNNQIACKVHKTLQLSNVTNAFAGIKLLKKPCAVVRGQCLFSTGL